MTLHALPNHDDEQDDTEATEALPTMGQLIRETGLMLYGLQPGEKVINHKTRVRVATQPHHRELQAIGGEPHKEDTKIVQIEFQRVGRTPTFTLLGEYGEKMQPLIWEIRYSPRPGAATYSIYDAHNPTQPHTNLSVAHVQTLQKHLEKYQEKSN